MDNELLDNLDKIHATELGVERIRKNLCLDAPDAVEWCKQRISTADDILRKGKNWHVRSDSSVITINAHNYTIITAHKERKAGKLK